MQKFELKIVGKNRKIYPKVRNIWFSGGELFYQVDINKSGSVKCKSVRLGTIEYFSVCSED